MRILVVEDEVRLGAALQRGLGELGFAVEHVADGREGYLRARDGAYDAVVLDIMLPGMSGYEVCKQLRAAGVWTPVLMLTAKDGEYDEADALDLGADDYLRKPFAFVVLVARLHALLRRGAPERPATLAVGDLVLDPAGRTVRRGDVGIELSRREFALLEYLMRNAGDAKSKLEILEHVWGSDFERAPNVVEVYVGYLRRKVDVPFGTRTVQTVRGQGYRVAAE